MRNVVSILEYCVPNRPGLEKAHNLVLAMQELVWRKPQSANNHLFFPHNQMFLQRIEFSYIKDEVGGQRTLDINHIRFRSGKDELGNLARATHNRTLYPKCVYGIEQGERYRTDHGQLPRHQQVFERYQREINEWRNPPDGVSSILLTD